MNKIILALLAVFILTAGTSVIFAEEVTVGGISFDVPGNYSVNKTTNNSCILKNNASDNYTISIVPSESSDFALEKNSRISSGFTFLSEENYTSTNDIDINQQNFIKNESYFSFYSFDVGNSSYSVSYIFPVHDNVNNQTNPVNEIIESIQWFYFFIFIKSFRFT